MGWSLRLQARKVDCSIENLKFEVNKFCTVLVFHQVFPSCICILPIPTWSLFSLRALWVFHFQPLQNWICLPYLCQELRRTWSLNMIQCVDWLRCLRTHYLSDKLSKEWIRLLKQFWSVHAIIKAVILNCIKNIQHIKHFCLQLNPPIPSPHMITHLLDPHICQLFRFPLLFACNVKYSCMGRTSHFHSSDQKMCSFLNFLWLYL